MIADLRARGAEPGDRPLTAGPVDAMLRPYPGEKILRSLRWSDAWLSDYLRNLEDPASVAEEEERAEHKAALYARYRAVRDRRT